MSKSNSLLSMLDDLDRKEEEAQKRRAQFDAPKYQKPPAGKSRWRILPCWDGDVNRQFYREYSAHWIKDGEKVLTVYPAVDVIFGRENPIAERINEMLAVTVDENAKKALREMRGQRVFLVNALRIDGNAEVKGKVVLLALTSTPFAQWRAVARNIYDETQDNILSLDNGYDVTITKTGTGMNTEYSVVNAMKPSKVDPAVLEQAIDLDKYVDQEYDGLLQKSHKALDLVEQKLLGQSFVPSNSDALVPVSAVQRGTVIDQPMENTQPVTTGMSADDQKLFDELDNL